MEKRLVLVHLLPVPGADACVSGIRVDCIAAGASRRHVFLDTHEAPPNSHGFLYGYDTERARWLRPKAWRGSYPL